MLVSSPSDLDHALNEAGFLKDHASSAVVWPLAEGQVARFQSEPALFTHPGCRSWVVGCRVGSAASERGRATAHRPTSGCSRVELAQPVAGRFSFTMILVKLPFPFAA